MKKLLAAITAGLLGFSLSAFDVFSYVPLNEEITGYTKTEYSIETKFGEYFKTVSKKIEHKIDASGNDVESIGYTARGVPENKIQTVFDSVGNVMKQRCFDTKSGEDILLWTSEHIYKKGIKTESNDYDADGELKGKTKYKFDNDLLTEETNYKGNGVLFSKIVYKYDEEKRIVKETRYLSNGSLDEESSFEYKEDGKIDTITFTDSILGTIKKIFRYSDKGLVTEVTTYKVVSDSANIVTERLVLKYDAQNQISKISNYLVSEKFGTTVNELNYMADYTYSYGE